MHEIKKKINGKIYRFTNLGNNNKYDRAVIAAGENATDEQILAYYDKLGGNIQDQWNCQIKNGEFWQKEEEKLIKKRERDRLISLFVDTTSHPVVASLILIAIVALALYLFEIDLTKYM